MTKETPPTVGASPLGEGLDGIRYEGKIVEMGNLASEKRGLLIEVRPEVWLEISGFKQHDMMKMPNLLYKQVKLTIELLQPNAKLTGRDDDD